MQADLAATKELALVMQTQLVTMNTKLDTMNTKLDTMDTKLEAMQAELAIIQAETAAARLVAEEVQISLAQQRPFAIHFAQSQIEAVIEE